MSEKIGILSSLAEGIETAIPFYKDGIVIVEVDLKDYEIFFRSLYTSIVSYVHSLPSPHPPQLLPEQNFITICKYFLELRLIFVHGRALGTSVNIPIDLSDVPIPLSLLTMLNNIGVVRIFQSNVTVVPKVKHICDKLAPLVLQGCLKSIKELLLTFPNKTASDFNLAQSWNTAGSENGTSFWLLSVREMENQSCVAKNKPSVVVESVFPEWTPEDAVLAAIVQNGFDGKIVDFPTVYKSTSVNNALILRQQFHLGNERRLKSSSARETIFSECDSPAEML